MKRFFLPFFLYQTAVFLLALLTFIAGKILGLHKVGLIMATVLLLALELHVLLTVQGGVAHEPR